MICHYMEAILWDNFDANTLKRMFKEEEHEVMENANRMCNLMGGAK